FPSAPTSIHCACTFCSSKLAMVNGLIIDMEAASTAAAQVVGIPSLTRPSIGYHYCISHDLHGPEGKDETENVEIKVDEDTEEDTDEDDDDSQDSDYLVDEDNNVDDFDVDIENFEYNIDENVEFMGYTDDEGSRLSKRKLKPLRKQAYACEQIYKTYFYLGKEFPNKDEVKAYIKEHSIETIREIRMEKNDNQRVRAVCRGVIPFLLAFEDIGNDSGPSQSSGSKEKWTKAKNSLV
ncbi:mutator type transposase, partial [Tanacetum coccineum]